MAWYNEPNRHSLAAKGVKTAREKILAKDKAIAEAMNKHSEKAYEKKVDEWLKEKKSDEWRKKIRSEIITAEIKEENPSVYPIYKLHKEERKEAIEELRREGYPFYVYFETPFSYRYIGTNTQKDAKKVYNEIMTKNKDLYGCVVSVKNTNEGL